MRADQSLLSPSNILKHYTTRTKFYLQSHPERSRYTLTSQHRAGSGAPLPPSDCLHNFVQPECHLQEMNPSYYHWCFFFLDTSSTQCLNAPEFWVSFLTSPTNSLPFSIVHIVLQYLLCSCSIHDTGIRMF